MNHFKKFAMAAAISAMSLPMLLGAQTFEDHTKIRQLIGRPATPATDMPSCPTGSTLSGGQCVLISNQGTPYGPAWTSYFVGQTKCWGSMCWTIDASSRLNNVVPYELGSVILYTNDCYYSSVSGVRLSARPTGMNVAQGSAPTSWLIDAEPLSGACSP